jgi:protocatechuate 3,4-dioxygenase alpha subunit
MPIETLKETASQTAGPYLHIGMMPAAAGIAGRKKQPGNILASAETQGKRIRVEGYVYDGAESLVRDAQIEIWQANAQGKYNHPGDTQDKPLDPTFKGFGRAVTDFKTGLWWFDTIKPGVVPGRRERPMAPHLNVMLFARGINMGLQTRIYFDDEAAANAADPVINLVELPARRDTLIAKRTERDGQVVYRFDIHLQGEKETVFFDI